MSSTPSFASSSGASSRRPRPKSAGLPSRPPTAAGSGGIICDNRISAARTPRRCPRTPTGFGRTVTITRNGATWSGDVTDLRRVLIDAVRTGDECRVAACVEATATVASSAVDDRGWPALCVLVEHGASPSIMRLLLEHGAKVEGRVPGSRQTALHLAASRGYQVCVAYLVTAGANVNAVDCSGSTPLKLACRHGHSSTVRLLLRLGADVNDSGRYSTSVDRPHHHRNRKPNSGAMIADAARHETALHAAAAAGHVDCVKVLLEESDCRLDAVDEHGRTAIILAAVEGQMEVVDELANHLTVANPAERFICLENEDPSNGRTLLQLAVAQGWTSLVAKLIQLGVDLDRRDRDWKTAFSAAVEYNRREIIPLLVRAGCDVNVTDRSFYTALHHAAQAGHTDLLHMLATAAASSLPGGTVDVNLKAQYGVTPLMLASYAGHWRTVDELLRLGARPDVVDRHRASPLVYAVLTSKSAEPCPAVVKALIRHNANVDEMANVKALCVALDVPPTVIRKECLNNRLYAPVELAFIRGQSTTLAILLRAGCDVSRLHLSSETLFSSCPTTSGSDRRTMLRLVQNFAVATSNQNVTSLQRLCRRPALDALLCNARRRQLPIGDVIARLPATEDVRRLLSFDEIEQHHQRTCSTSTDDEPSSGHSISRGNGTGTETSNGAKPATSSRPPSAAGDRTIRARTRPRSALASSMTQSARHGIVTMYVPREAEEIAKRPLVSRQSSLTTESADSLLSDTSWSTSQKSITRLDCKNGTTTTMHQNDVQLKQSPVNRPQMTSDDRNALQSPADRTPTLIAATAACGQTPNSRLPKRRLPVTPSTMSRIGRQTCV